MANFNKIVIRDAIGKIGWKQLIDCRVQSLFTQFPFLSKLEDYGSDKRLRSAHNSEAIACLHRYMLLQVREATRATPRPAIRLSHVHCYTRNTFSHLSVKNLLKFLVEDIWLGNRCCG